MTPILNARLPLLPWMDAKLARMPGIQPPTTSWRDRDDAFAPQMAERDRLIAQTPDLVAGALDRAGPAVRELYDMVLADLAKDPAYTISPGQITRPDGVSVPLADRSDPLYALQTLGRLVQEDLCLMQEGTGEHDLTAAILCFPASWTLAEKLGRPLIGIHRPVREYSPDLARRVQRLFDAIQTGQGLWRMNYNTYADPALFQPRSESLARRVRPKDEAPTLPLFVRCERQCLLRLPETRAVLFSIHTYLVRASTLSEAEKDSLIVAQEARHLHSAADD